MAKRLLQSLECYILKHAFIFEYLRIFNGNSI